MIKAVSIQCILTEEVYREVFLRLRMDPRKSSQHKEGIAGSPFRSFWMADIHYNTSGHLHFLGIELDLSVLAAGEETPILFRPSHATYGQLCEAFREALIREFGADTASGIPGLEHWDCNSVHYCADVAQEDRDTVLSQLMNLGMDREALDADRAAGIKIKHAVAALTVYKKDSLMKNGLLDYKGKITKQILDAAGNILRISAHCRRGRLNRILRLKGMGVRPLEPLLRPEAARDVILPELKKQIRGARLLGYSHTTALYLKLEEYFSKELIPHARESTSVSGE